MTRVARRCGRPFGIHGTPANPPTSKHICRRWISGPGSRLRIVTVATPATIEAATTDRTQYTDPRHEILLGIWNMVLTAIEREFGAVE